MNPDTVRTLNEIKKNGWYRLSTSMGDGGWQEVRKFENLLGTNFKTYVLDATQSKNWDEIEVIKALSDEKAFDAFSKLYHLEMFEDWEIRERIVEFRLVKTRD